LIDTEAEQAEPSTQPSVEEPKTATTHTSVSVHADVEETASAIASSLSIEGEAGLVESAVAVGVADAGEGVWMARIAFLQEHLAEVVDGTCKGDQDWSARRVGTEAWKLLSSADTSASGLLFDSALRVCLLEYQSAHLHVFAYYLSVCLSLLTLLFLVVSVSSVSHL
jgi:hypothetical protein